MYCKNCGKEIADDSRFCTYCGVSAFNEVNETSEFAQYDYNLPKDEPSLALAVLGFISPIIGIIVYFVTRKESPRKARSALNGALVTLSTMLLYALVSYFTKLFILG